MKYFIGIFILLFGIYNKRFGIKDQLYKKKLLKGKVNLINFNIADYGNRFIFVLRIKA